ncbi:C-type lectin 37Da [Culex quinquefasciatus]|uniref:C-type lectin 37Da n=1 Tax=Culex quinquefasciatus TaxID=7176 RepID=UPI0018E3972D|nr:C-type lectin 37Da [Culex quinquefasciatus]
MRRSALFLAAVVLFSGIYAEEASEAVIPEDSGKSGDSGESEKHVKPAHPVESLNPDPEDFLNRGKNYTFICDVKQNFFSAWRKCIDRKLELATIESLEDNLAFEAALGSYREQVYTSGTDMGKEGSFVWLVNKRVIPGWNNFEAWETGEPNNNAGNENCLVGIVKGGRVQWNDIPCNNEYCYMCQDILT